MEIAAANEESHSLFPDLELKDKEAWQALNAVLARLNEFQAKEDIPRDQVTGPQIYKMMLVLTAPRLVREFFRRQQRISTHLHQGSCV